MQDLRGDIDDREHGRLPGATHDTRQRAQDPVGQRAGEDRVRVLDGRGKSGPTAAHQRVQGRARNEQHRCEHGRHAASDHEPVDDKRRGVLVASRSDGAGDGRRDGAAHARVGHLLHEHQQRKHERQPGKRARVELTDEVRVDARRHGDEHHVDHDVRDCEPQERGDDGTFEEQAPTRRAWILDGF